MDPKLLSSIVPAGINAVGSLASSGLSIFGQKSENQKNRDWQEHMWNLNNAYNTPLAQRERMESAGYNPYLLGSDNGASGQSSLPSAPATSPLPAMENPFHGSAQLLQQGLQVESNVELQRMKSLETISDVMLKLYKDGGQKQVDSFMREFAPTLKSLNFEGSFYEQRMQREFLRMDIENDRADLERSLVAKFGDREANAKLKLLDQELQNKLAEVRKLDSEVSLNHAKRKEALAHAYELGSEFARNMAESRLFGMQASQIEGLFPYIRSVAEDDSIRSFMDLDDKSAEYVMNAGKRKQQRKPVSRTLTEWEESSRNNFVTAFLRGASSALPNLPPVFNSKKFSPQYRYNYGPTTNYINPTGQ